jgi:limonene 1,2-monooxygenase
MPQDWPLKFGAFFAPFHPVGQSPTLAYEYDLDRAEWLDKFGYDEVWFGEHHSGGYELIGSPEIFIAAAAQRTKNIKLGTGVTSLPYHHPWLVADRWVQLDHMTRGRCIFGTGPGALPTDAWQMGIDPVDQRRMMEESLDAIYALFASEEPVNRETDWFVMKDCRLQVRPYTYPHPEIAVAAMVTPSGPRLAGQTGASLLSLSMQIADGFAAIGNAWGVVNEQAEKVGGPTPDRKTWRILGTMHIAETREQAIDDCLYGLRDFSNYFGGGAGFVPLAEKVDGDTSERDFVEAYANSPSSVIGTPDDAIEYHRVHRRPHRAVRWLRHLPAARPRLGLARAHAELLPPLRRKGDPALPGSPQRTARVARLGDGEARRAVRSRRPSDDERHPKPRRGKG